MTGYRDRMRGAVLFRQNRWRSGKRRASALHRLCAEQDWGAVRPTGCVQRRTRLFSIVDRIADDWPGHAVAASATAAKLGSGNGDHLDALFAQ